MLDVCRRRAEECEVASRCEFHKGYLDSLPPSEPFDAATSFLVSQFILAREVRSAYFRTIARRLRPGGYVVNADLTSDTSSAAYQSLLEVWLRMMKAADFAPAQQLERLRSVYGRDVAVLPAAEVGAIIASGGFDTPVAFFQAGLIQAWYAQRTPAAVGTGTI